MRPENIKGPCKRTQQRWAQHVASVCMEPRQCWHLLRVVWNRSNFGATSPNISIVLWPAKRSETMLRMEPQQCWPRENVCTRPFQSVFRITIPVCVASLDDRQQCWQLWRSFACMHISTFVQGLNTVLKFVWTKFLAWWLFLACS